MIRACCNCLRSLCHRTDSESSKAVAPDQVRGLEEQRQYVQLLSADPDEKAHRKKILQISIKNPVFKQKVDV